MSSNYSDVGINLAGVNYWGSEYPFIDRMKAAGSWTVVDSTGAQSTTGVPVDANGYPTSMPAGSNYMYTALEVDPRALEMTDRYVLTYSGSAKVVASGAKVISTAPGKIVFEVTKDSTTQLIKVSDIDPANPITAMHVVREDQVDLFQKGVVFNPELLEKIQPFSTLRFMDWGATNSSDLAHWEDRPMVGDRSWANSEGGVPIEVMVDLSNQTHKNMWINIPFEADDNYVRQLLTYVRDHLDPKLQVHVEYSNEVWNFAFDQAKAALKKGDELWGVDANGDGKIDPNDKAEHVADGFNQYYGYRAAQIASIANSVFSGTNDARLEMVMSTFGTGTTASILKGIAKADVGTASQLFDEYSIHTYFGNLGTGTEAELATLMGWARSGQAGIDAAFQEFQEGKLSNTVSMQDLPAKFAKHAALANSLGLELVAYEGGAAVLSTKVAAADRAELNAFYKNLMNDPRMADLYRQMYDMFSAAGGKEFLAFNDAHPNNSNYGHWGALESIYQDSSVRYDVLAQLAQKGASASQAPSNAPVSDSMMGTGGDDDLRAMTGHHKIYGGAGADTITAGAGNDHVYGESANGGADGNDLISAGGGSDYVNGNAGNDTIGGGDGSDRLYGGRGDDSISGDAGNDKLNGNRGNDYVAGGADNDVLRGGADNDTLIGGSGNDVLSGDVGIDRLTGGTGADRFVFGSADSPIGTALDTVTDFEQGVDRILVGFAPEAVLVGTTSYSSVDAARSAAQALFNGHAGNSEVAAMSFSGGSTLLFWSSGGGATIDSVVAFQGQSASAFDLNDFI